MAGFRHEWKIEINAMDAAVIRSRLRAVAKEDAQGEEGSMRYGAFILIT